MTRTRRIWLAVGAALALATALLLWALSMGAPDSFVARLFIRHDQTWQQMIARGTWRVGMDPSFPPFEMLDAAGRVQGYDVDLARELAAAWGLKAEIIPIGFDSLLDALATGQVDSVVSALPYDPRATRDYAYSPPYFEAGVRLVVRDGAPISTTQALSGTQVAVEWGSMGDMVGRRLQREGIGLTRVPYETPADAVAGLVDDDAIAALLIDQVSLRQAQGQGAAIVAVGPALESAPYVIAAPLRAVTLQEQLRTTLAQFATDGTLAELEARWFGPLP